MRMNTEKVTRRAQVDSFLWGTSVPGHGNPFANQKNAFAKVGKTLAERGQGGRVDGLVRPA